MLQRFERLIVAFGFTAALLVALIVILGTAADRSASAQPMGISSAPLRLQAATPFTIGLKLIASGLNNPVHVTNANDDSGRLFVVERLGRVRVVKNGLVLSGSFLSITTKVESGFEEQGLLSIAFDPDYKSNGTFYIYYTTRAAGYDRAIVIARYVVSNPAADAPTILSVTNLITIDHPEANHNGGQLQFGPNDNYLYIGTGDGGGAGDRHGPIGNGQNLGALLGKILRINVRGVPTYSIPVSNPFTQTIGAKKEIWAYGVRNPWRFSFDRATGDMYIGEVGENCWEEIDYQPASSHGGENYGWRLMEGFHAFDPGHQYSCNQPLITPAGLKLPIFNYSHNFQASAVAGGYIYRGRQFPWMNGIYFYADAEQGKFFTLQQIMGVWQNTLKLNSSIYPSSFGEDQSGELYVVDLVGGKLYQVVSSLPPNLSDSTKTASNGGPQPGDSITYTLILRNSGSWFPDTVRVTDTIPISLSYLTGSFTATSGSVDESGAPVLKWNGSMSDTWLVTLAYAVTVSTVDTQVVTNDAIIDPGFTAPFTRTAAIIVNGLHVYLPLIFESF